MKRLIILAIISFYALVDLFSQITVAKDSTGNFTHIQNAIDNAPVGSIITVKAGVYHENIVLKQGIVLIGQDMPTIYGNGVGAVVTMANKSCVYNFEISNSGSEPGIHDCGVLAENIDSCQIIGNYIVQNGHFGIIIKNAFAKIYYNKIIMNDPVGIYLSTNARFDIAFNIIKEQNHSAIDMQDEKISGKIYNNDFILCNMGIYYGSYNQESLNIFIYNNIFYSNTTAINCPKNTAKKITYNCFYKNEHNFYSGEENLKPGSTNLLKDPLFESPEGFSYSLKENSPCNDRGVKNCDIGAVGIFSGKEKDACKNIKFGKTNVKYVINVAGIATNNTDDEKTSKIVGLILSDNGINFTFEGQYDNKTLFGHFKMTGKKIPDNNGESFTINFDEGECLLGNDNSGYPDRFIMPHTGNITIYNDKAIGNYFCGKVIPMALNEQNGSYQFDKITSNLPIKSIIQIKSDRTLR